MSKPNFNRSELFDVICKLVEIKSLRVAVDCSVQSGVAVGALSALGGLVFGPRGIAIGGVLGSLGAAYMMDGAFKSVPEIIREDLTEKEKQRLFNAVNELLTAENIVSMAILTSKLLNAPFREVLKETIVQSLKIFNYNAF